ncbi:EAL domain-containing protein [Armatimonas sp.]|uniref:putative bifunctional diguanylate cyclase/phosphodiesterase n=1 Tax=Armatimonas sp. TaxID=1872638 RepID=UPI00286C32DF|nr:EAL domain-containing protein [Armatimonas sp.]
MGLFAWQNQQRQALGHAAYLLNVEAQARIHRLLELTGAPLTNYCQTVAQQKDLTDFLADPLALPEGLDGVWIFDNSGERLYTQQKHNSIALTWAAIREQLNNNNRRFFIETPQGLLELHRASLPQDAGVVFAGKLWTTEVLKQIEGISGSTAALCRRSHAPLEDLDEKGRAQLEFPLDSHNPHATLHLSFHVPSLQMQHEAFQATPIWLFLFSTALLLVLSIALYHWISFPLRRLTAALREQSLEPLATLKPDTQEVHELAGMVRAFFAQRQTIQQDRDLLEARVEERTQELSDAIYSMSETQARLKAVLANLPVVVFALDDQAKVTFFEGQGMNSIGIITPQVVGRSIYRHFHFRRTSEYGRYIEDVLTGEKRAWTMPLGPRSFDVQCSPLRGENNQVVGIIGVALDVTERIHVEDRLVHQAKHDALTGLPNRHFFQERLEQALARAARDSRQVALLFLDLDNFKLVNDTLGHAAGDQLLQQITLRIHGLLGPGRMLARLGGDEFTILVEHFSSPTNVEQLAERIRMVMEESFLLESQEIFCRSSVGVVYSNPESTVGEMLRNADIAMYRSKEKGKGRHTTFDESMNLHLQERLALEADLRHALQNDELMLYYQPIISLESGLMVGVEALARWEHPRLGTILPSRFVAIAEESGLSSSLDYWALRTACRQFGIWNKQIETPLNISVNISTRQFQRSDLDRAVQMILADTELAPQKLTLEITEGVMMQDPTGASDILGRLKALGVQIAIDDFGTGYSSMAYLSNLPIDTLKIDRSFITHMTDQKENVAIVEAIIHLARALSLKVTSEGVETAEQVKVLQWLKCHQVQGYFYSKPLTQSQLEKLIFQPKALKKAA